jgi:hypothetical protein
MDLYSRGLNVDRRAASRTIDEAMHTFLNLRLVRAEDLMEKGTSSQSAQDSCRERKPHAWFFASS